MARPLQHTGWSPGWTTYGLPDSHDHSTNKASKPTKVETPQQPYPNSGRQPTSPQLGHDGQPQTELNTDLIPKLNIGEAE